MFDETCERRGAGGFDEDACRTRETANGCDDLFVADFDAASIRHADRANRPGRVARPAHVDAVGDGLSRACAQDPVAVRGVNDRRSAFRLNADHLRQTINQAEAIKVAEAFPHPADDASVADPDKYLVRNFPVQLLADFQRRCLLALRHERIVARASLIPPISLACLQTEVESLVVTA